MHQSILDNLTVSQLIKKYPTFYGTRRFINRVRKSLQLVPIMSQMNPFRIVTSYYHKIRFNMTGSPK